MVAIMQHLAILFSASANDSSTLEASISASRKSISALDICINTLEGSSKPWETLSKVSAFVVFFGIVGEVVVIISEYFEDLDEWRLSAWMRPRVFPPDRPPRWRFWFDIVATVIVLAGVFGEAWGSLQVDSINSELRSKTSVLRADSDQLLALVTQEVGSAETDIGDVQKKADVLNGQLDATASKVGELNALVQSQLPRRRLLDEGKANFINALKSFATQTVIVTSCANLSPQSERAKVEQGLITLLGSQGASWDVRAVAWDPCLNTPLAGITVNFTDSRPAAVRAGTALVNTLNKLNITTTANVVPWMFLVNRAGIRAAGLPPNGLLAREPETIVVTVGINPMTSVQ